MFECGDRVVYPMYGAGVIESVEIRQMEGASTAYYHIVIPNGNLKITLSALKAENVGLRSVSDAATLQTVIEDISARPVKANSNWNQRYKENLERIKTGSLDQVAEVVRRLTLRERERALSGAEKKMLNNARQIVVSEIALSTRVEKEQAESLLMEWLMLD